MSVAPDTVEEVAADLAKGLKKIADGKNEYDRREKYQRGDVGEVVAHAKLKQILGDYGKRFRLNYAGVPAVALNDRIDLQGIRTGNDGADRLLLERFWSPNDLADDADDIHLKAAYLGDYYGILELIDAEDDQPDAEGETGTGAGTVELTPKDPRTTVIIYQRTNSRRPDFGLQVVDLGGGKHTAYVYYDDVTWTFDTVPATPKDFDGFNPEKYTVRLVGDGEPGEGEPDLVDNPGGFPVLHWRPDSRPYGTPVNANAYGPQDAITKLNATLMASVDYHGLPERYALLDPDRAIGDDLDRDFNSAFPDGDVVPGSAKGEPKLNSAPGSFQFLDGVKETGSYDTSDPKGFTDPMALQIGSMAALTRTPLYEFMLEGSADQPSGEARRRADKPITSHAKKLRGQYGSVWAQAAQWVLTSLRQSAAYTLEVVWAPLETSDDKEGLENAKAKVELGIPPRQALIEAGWEAEQVAQWLPGEGEGIALSPQLLGLLATLLQQMGQARNLGAVGGDQIATILAPYFPGAAAPEPEPPTGA